MPVEDELDLLYEFTIRTWNAGKRIIIAYYFLHRKLGFPPTLLQGGYTLSNAIMIKQNGSKI